MKTPSIGIDQNQSDRFMDKYWGRVPQMIHSVPEANIWLCNPEYIWLIENYISGDLVEKNVSIELYAEIEDLVNASGGSRPLTEEETKLLECYGVENAPGDITSLVASDNLRGTIVIVWDYDTEAIPAPTYGLYEDGVLIVSDADSPYTRNVEDDTRDYYVVATNEHGTSTSNTDSGTALSSTEAPDPIIDFTATDNRTGQVKMRWTHFEGIPAATYKLYENDVFVVGDISDGYIHYINPGTRDYYVTATNSLGVVTSNTDAGTSLYNEGAPGEPLVFNASDNEYEQVTCTWVNEGIGNPIPTYSLFEDNVEVETDITSPFIHTVEAGTRSYFVVASNVFGASASNTNNGTALLIEVAPDPITSVVATDDQYGKVVITWDLDSVAKPTATYNIHQDGVQIATSVTSPYTYSTSIGGTWDFIVEAVNSAGTSTGTDEGTALEPLATELTLPQFTDTQSITLWLQGQSVSPTKDIIITNTLHQPTLRFDGVSVTTGAVKLLNSGTIMGTNSGECGIELLYQVELINTGTIYGAGGKGGQGGTGATGPTRTVDSNTTVNYDAGDSLWYNYDSSQYSPIGFKQTYFLEDCDNNQWIRTIQFRDGSSHTFTAPENDWSPSAWLGGALLRMFGSTSVCLAIGPYTGSYIEYVNPYAATKIEECTVPGGPGGLGGLGGDGERFETISPFGTLPVVDGVNGETGTTVVACDGETSSTGYTGGKGGRGGVLGASGVSGYDGVSNSNSGLSGEQNGYAINGSGNLASSSIVGTLVGGTN